MKLPNGQKNPNYLKHTLNNVSVYATPFSSVQAQITMLDDSNRM